MSNPERTPEEARRHFERIAAELGGQRLQPNGDVDASYQCKCPAHEDRKASLTLSLSGNKLLANCHAGCSFSAIVSALEARGLAAKSERASSLKTLKNQPQTATSERASRKEKAPIEAYYDYRDASGDLIFQKIRRTDKSFTQRAANGQGGWVHTLKGCPRLVYHRDRIQQVSGTPGARLFVCEGEKDADNLNALQIEGTVATTNLEGGAKWMDDYTEQCAGFSEVIVFEDTDETGRARTAKILKSFNTVTPQQVIRVVRFVGMAEKADVSDWLAEVPGRGKEDLELVIDGAVPRTAAQWQEELARQEEEREGGLGPRWTRAQSDDRATAAEYVGFVAQLPGVKGLKSCLVTDELLALYRGEWLSAKETAFLDYVRGHARDHGKFFNLAAFEEALERWHTDTAVPEMLCEVVEWDGRDRIREMSEVFRFKNVAQETFYQLILAWGAGIYRRLHDSRYQPITPVFQGAQGLGKDSLIQALTDGLGRYVKKLDFGAHEVKEARRMLHTALVFLIPEFDKLARTDIASLKDILTTDQTDTRLPYEKRDKTRRVRASFIASCNVHDILVDHTGNRRFWLFECEYLGVKPQRTVYPGAFFAEDPYSDRLQIQAQFRAAYEAGFEASEEALNEMQRFVEASTPDNPNDVIVEDWDERIAALSELPDRFSGIDGAPLFKTIKVAAVFEALSKGYHRSVQSLQRTLSAAGRRERLEQGSFWRGSQKGSSRCQPGSVLAGLEPF